MVDGVSLACIIFVGDSLCKITGGTARKDSYLARNPAVLLCCAKSSDEDCSVLLYFFTVIDKQPARKYVKVHFFFCLDFNMQSYYLLHCTRPVFPSK